MFFLTYIVSITPNFMLYNLLYKQKWEFSINIRYVKFLHSFDQIW